MTLSSFCFPTLIYAPPSVGRRLFSNATILGSGLVQTIVAMISSNLARRGHPSRIFLAANSLKGRAAGIRLDSVVMTDNLATVLESEIDSVLGHMADMLEVDGALKHTLGLD